MTQPSQTDVPTVIILIEARTIFETGEDEDLLFK